MVANIHIKIYLSPNEILLAYASFILVHSTGNEEFSFNDFLNHYKKDVKRKWKESDQCKQIKL